MPAQQSLWLTVRALGRKTWPLLEGCAKHHRNTYVPLIFVDAEWSSTCHHPIDCGLIEVIVIS